MVERLERLSSRPTPKKRSSEEIRRWLETEVWPRIPDDTA